MIYNPESGTNETTYRQQAPVQGRWLTPDPAGMAAVDITNPQSWNMYAYVNNNPVSNTDPLGLFCVWDNGSYDSNDDPDTGNQAACEGDGTNGGGTWFNGNPSDWDPNAGDWSNQASLEFAGWAQGINPSVGDFGDPTEVPDAFASATSSLVATTTSALPNQILSGCSAQAAAFVSANGAYANQIAQRTGVSATNLLGLSALESNFGTSNLAMNHNNYFGLTTGSAFKGTTGVYTTPDGRNFGAYPSPGFFTSGLSFAQSFQGRRVSGVTDPAVFASRLTTPPLAFNSEPGYAGKLVSRIAQVSPCQ